MPSLILPSTPQSQAFLTALRTGPAEWWERMEPQPHAGIVMFVNLEQQVSGKADCSWKPVWGGDIEMSERVEHNKCRLAPYRPGDVVDVREEWCVAIASPPTATVEYRDGEFRRDLDYGDRWQFWIGMWLPANSLPDWAIRFRIECLSVEAVSSCVKDTDKDGNCHLCYRDGGCKNLEMAWFWKSTWKLAEKT